MAYIIIVSNHVTFVREPVFLVSDQSDGELNHDGIGIKKWCNAEIYYNGHDLKWSMSKCIN